MTMEAAQKVTPRHLARTAYLYIRQSTIRQVVENSESTQRQYGLRQRAVALGWPPEQIIVIDTDLGQSGARCPPRAQSPLRRRVHIRPRPVAQAARRSHDPGTSPAGAVVGAPARCAPGVPLLG